MVGNITFLMIFAVFDPSPLTLWINCSFSINCNYDDLLKLESLVDGMKLCGKVCKPDDCDVCIQGKMVQSRNRKPRTRSTAPLQLVHTDLAGPITPVSTEGFVYAIVFTDDYSGATFVYFLKSKADTVAATEKFLADSAPF